MRRYTDTRSPDAEDQLWCCEHPSVYTLGQAGRPEHVLDAGNIPLVQSDRGGQVTWHGPGQIVIYVLVDLRRAGFGVRSLVTRLEESMIELLQRHGIEAVARADAPGVYVDGAKIGALGLRVRRGCSYHGLALNVDADLSPFQGINPCGYRDLAVTRTVDLGVPTQRVELAEELLGILQQHLAPADASSE